MAFEWGLLPLVRLVPSRYRTKQEIESDIRMRGALELLVQPAKFQMDTGQQLGVVHDFVDQLLPIRHCMMVQHHLEREILQQQALCRFRDRGEALSFLFGHKSYRSYENRQLSLVRNERQRYGHEGFSAEHYR